MPSTARENYLKALYHLDRENDRISITELSNRLQVSKPTANNMVKSLQERGWVVYQKYKPLQLTESGRKAAIAIIRKHRLTEMFLYKVMGFGWEEVHEIAEQIEHIDSDKLFARMDEMLDYPSFDPHGSPIPDAQGEITRQQHQALIDIAPGSRARLIALGDSSRELLQYLNQRHIELGTLIELIEVEAFDQTCLIRVGEQSPFVVSRKVGERLLVEVV